MLSVAEECNLSGKKQGNLPNIKEEPTKFYTGLNVYNVNNYDVFRNPVQAKEILLEALEVQRLVGNTVWDGEKDGRFIKVLPVNRII